MTQAPDETASARKQPASRELVAGSTLGKYRLDRILGSGGMGVVWAAHDPDLERAVALKVLRYDDPSPDLRARLLREARAMAKLKHPNVLTVYEVDSEGARDFIAMELVDGASLDVWLTTKPSREEIWATILAAGRGLAAAHHAGLVHRDFKPHNVLRSCDGRVLVTDFGLARGHGDDKAAAVAMEKTLPADVSAVEATIEATPATAVDAPLTRTGVLVGTPAYMAPEQFLGVFSGPPTDQFAYCVTAWQLFAGARPFKGDTLEELRRASSAGVANVKSDMPGAIRAVLARGLEPDPAKRWPDLNALLAALERAKQLPRKRVQIGIAIAALSLSGLLAIKLAREPSVVTTDSSSTCPESPEAEMAKAWSPDDRQALAKRFSDSAAFEYTASELDIFAKDWIADYRSACTGAPSTKTFAKLGCLLGERDEVAALGDLFPTVPAEAFSEIEMGGVLPRVQACDGESPVAPPTMPDDATKRARIVELRPKIIGARFVPPQIALATVPPLLAEAQKLGWDPLTAEAHQSLATAARHTLEDYELAREHFQAATEVARRVHYYHLEAAVWIDLLDAEMEVTLDPAIDPFANLIAQARIAAHNAGDDPVWLARILFAEARYAESRSNVDDAIAKYHQARVQAAAARDVAQSLWYAGSEVNALLRRNRPEDVQRAWDVLVESERTAVAAKLSDKQRFRLAGPYWSVARLRGDLATAHKWNAHLDNLPPTPTLPPNAVTMTGKVVDANGNGVAGAIVVAWRGVLQGDATRMYETPHFLGDLATTGADGTYTIRATADGGIIAELGDRRSRPRAIADHLTLALEPTRAVAGTVTSDDEVLSGIKAIAEYKLGPKLGWQLVTPVGRLHDYRFAGLPTGDARLQLDSYLDPNGPTRKLDVGPVRDGATPRWPVGPSLDVIVRGAKVAPVNIWVLRGRHTPKTRAALDAIVEQSSEAIRHLALVIGIGDQTVEGMKKYARGDRHANFLGIAPGEVTICAADLEPTATVICKIIEIPGAKVELRDGHGVYPTIAVPLEF